MSEGESLDDQDDGEEERDTGDDTFMADNIPDDSIHTFEGHTAGVYSVAWSPTNPFLVATGGGDDKGFMWYAGEEAYRSTQGQVIELTGHTDTISSIKFNFDGSILATGGMDGCVKLWKTDTGRCLHSLSGPGDSVEWISWHPRGNVILAGCADYTTWMWSADSGECMQVFTGHSASVTCGDFSADGKLVITGGGEGDSSLRFWDPRSGVCKTTLQGSHFHVAGLTALAVHPESGVVLTGSEDGTSKVVAMDTGRIITTLKGHDEDSSIESVLFLPKLSLAATGGMDGKLIVWDVPSSTPRVVCEHPEGITRMICHPLEPIVFTGCIDGIVRAWDVRTGTCTRSFHGHQDAIQDLAISVDGTHVLSGSEDQTARVFYVV